ncbi:MAG: bifunctional ornithine acetyltransferase/N-acetylglutamate synthase, partial [Dehalococcoidia bacterium]
GDLCLVKGGCAVQFDVQYAQEIMSRDEVPFRVCLNLGGNEATAWGCDLTEEYVSINAEYTT